MRLGRNLLSGVAKTGIPVLFFLLQPGHPTDLPTPYPSGHYGLLQEYSPFVKSMESAKEAEKSPELVVVGYGRMRGEDHVILQQKVDSEKREKIGSRFGSKDFPYRLLSVTNRSSRKDFVAFLEDKNKKKFQVRYATESVAPPPAISGGIGAGGAVVSGAGVASSPSPGNNLGTNPNAQTPVPTGQPEAQPKNAVGLSPQKAELLEKIEGHRAKLNDPASDQATKERHQRWLETAQRKLEELEKTPVDLNAPPVEPSPAR